MRRRTFLKNTFAAGLAGILGSCDLEPIEQHPRDELINRLQLEALELEEQEMLIYHPKKQYSYAASVWGEEISANLARDNFPDYKNQLTYTAGETTVRAYLKGKLRIWEEKEEISERENEKKFLKEQVRTDLLLKQILQKNAELYFQKEKGLF